MSVENSNLQSTGSKIFKGIALFIALGLFVYGIFQGASDRIAQATFFIVTSIVCLIVGFHEKIAEFSALGMSAKFAVKMTEVDEQLVRMRRLIKVLLIMIDKDMVPKLAGREHLEKSYQLLEGVREVFADHSMTDTIESVFPTFVHYTHALYISLAGKRIQAIYHECATNYNVQGKTSLPAELVDLERFPNLGNILGRMVWPPSPGSYSVSLARAEADIAAFPNELLGARKSEMLAMTRHAFQRLQDLQTKGEPAPLDEVIK